MLPRQPRLKAKLQKALPVLGAVMTFVAFVTHDYLAEQAKDYAAELHAAQSERSTRQEFVSLRTFLKKMQLSCDRLGICVVNDGTSLTEGGGGDETFVRVMQNELAEDSRSVRDLMEGQDDLEDIAKAMKEQAFSDRLAKLKSTSQSITREQIALMQSLRANRGEAETTSEQQASYDTESQHLDELSRKQETFLADLLLRAKNDLERKRRRAEISTTVSVWCYVIGAIFVLAGKILEPSEEIELGA